MSLTKVDLTNLLKFIMTFWLFGRRPCVAYYIPNKSWMKWDPYMFFSKKKEGKKEMNP